VNTAHGPLQGIEPGAIQRFLANLICHATEFSKGVSASPHGPTKEKRPPPLDGLRDSKSPIPPREWSHHKANPFSEMCAGKGRSDIAD
jgi:hypothetical protein